MKAHQTFKKLLLAGLATTAMSLGAISNVSANEDLTVKDDTGTDPRDFGAKFMPYYRYDKLDNGLEQTSVTFFGMVPLTKTFALTYEIPFVNVDASEAPIGNTCNDNGFTAPVCAPAAGSSSPFEATGLGDTNIRGFTPVGRAMGMTWLAGAEIWLPTHSEEYLGADRITLAPMVANVLDLDFLPMPGAFMAQMHFYEFDVISDDDESDVSRYKGRWFFMIPLNERFKIYSLTEMQPIYDFEEDHFSFWFGPEFGTAALGEGKLLYAKPGWGVDPDEDKGDREFSFEVGFRYFY